MTDPDAAAAVGPGEATSAAFGRLRHAWERFALNPLAVIGLIIIALMVLAAIGAPLLATYDPLAQDLTRTLQPPSGTNWFGTDDLGRDVYSRLVYGARTSLYISILVTMIVAPVGLLIGTASAYLGGWIDIVLMRITDIFLSFPSLILALALSAALGAGLENAVVAIALTSWPPLARLARAEALVVRNSDYVSAARMQGASGLRIIVRHIMPMCMPSLLVRVTLNLSGIILATAGLGFLGLGVQPPTPEWGSMAALGRQYLLDAWWLTTIPGVAILIVSLAFNLLGDGLRDVVDVRSN